MGNIDYEALIEGRGDAELAARKQANRLAEIARNLETLHEMAEEQAKEQAPGAPVIPMPDAEKRSTDDGAANGPST